jgi:phosphoribosylamine--glycine ligase
VDVKATDISGMVTWAKENKMDFVMVAPDDPLAMGMVDALEDSGIRAFGPRKNAAIVEGSKAFSKELMKKYGIPTAAYEVFTDKDAALQYVEAQGAPIVIKCDGLALGKGVVVAQTLDEAKEAVVNMMENKAFGEAGAKVVIEECMTGPEVTVLAFTDGKTIVPMPSSQDHKRAYDGDKGPNTGGMGAISPCPNYTPEHAKICMETIFKPTIDALNAEGRTFQGVIYFGMMLTPQGPKVVEYNARFGDPECQAVLSLLETDLMDILEACVDGTLDQVEVRFRDASSCCLVLASGGYPVAYEKGKEITGLDRVTDAVVFHAGTKKEDGKFLTNGGRVLGVTAVAPTLREAVDKAYQQAAPISFEKMHFRKDIGYHILDGQAKID